MEYYSATKKKKVLASQRKETWKNLKRILLSERDKVLCDSTYTTFWRRQKYDKEEKTTAVARGCRRKGKEEMNKQCTGDS